MSEAFLLDPNPSFKSVVEIPKHGDEEPGKLGFTFKHHPITEYQKWLKAHQQELEKLDDDADGIEVMVKGVQHVATGWALPDEFDADNIRRLLVNYGRAYTSIMATYFAELMGIRAKN